ncbi:hypothetical protein OKW21_000624 [Catalinimonas alkaloidigena]|uniref:hypothetical protein n=1 Tax=Catalinimonas alkaloidigena TaxID=1075417 RepID=UPI002406E8C1|nr:hypothetical protein [Catalinimonas alkaloidigena]MDF9795361.1 hypothetical protein [Catalinimonas alkaloidigena]
MTKRLLLMFLVLIGFLVFWNNFYPRFSVEGVYVSNNTRPIIEGPKSIDTLTIYSNGTFENGSWGKGEYSIDGDQIHFDITYDYGKFGFNTYLSRTYFIGSPKIQLDSDLGFYYEKIK